MKKFITNCAICASMLAAVSLVTFTTGCAGDRYSRSTGQTFDDAGTTARVKSKLLADPNVSGLDVKVDTFRGTVQLTGFVDSPQQKQLAEQLARDVDGVQLVRNDIMVKMNEAAGGEAIKKNRNDRDGASIEVEADTDRKGIDIDADADRNGVDVDVDRKRDAELEIKADTDNK